MLSSDFQAADPAAYMSPMDLYDHIFWGESRFSRSCARTCRLSFAPSADGRAPDVPDPYQPGVDAMNFDFLAHPPPGQPPQRQFYF